ncbi:MYND-type zinc finger-containing chromatin reader Zmynd8-like [Sitodiplosis mosellana]|uniref:MYND-type zinc finger-containing chromatin reader Zmynd8-like n=1 Tax=Sitodiplosis mosellana TaxID=263140 RepID=UPI002444AD1D|nr:MYND-type zinc finger-containing chromatin reader Zmynd8-like [Sitodiplosis mosellana]
MENPQQNVTENVNQSNNEAIAHDKFCWFCHTKNSRGYSCLKCFRSFHVKCLKKNFEIIGPNDQGNSLICPVCKSLERMETSVDKQSISELLKLLMAKISDNSVFTALNNLDSICVVHPIDLNEINRKIDSQSFGSFSAFLMDINIVYHNCCCVRNDKHEFIFIAANNLVKLCTTEIENMSSCAECYKNMHTKPDHWRSLACRRPHLVLWIELKRGCYFWPAEKGYSYWPAKLISIGRKNVKAIFFHDAEFVEIPRTNCLIYSKSETKPSKSFKLMPNPTDMLEVLKEVNLYEQNIKAKFGHFESKLECVRFDRLDVHMRAMFPEYTGSPLDAQNYLIPADETNNTDDKDELPENDEASFSTKQTDKIPKKRQRISVGFDNGPEPSDGESIIQRKIRQTRRDWENIENLTMNLENTNKKLTLELKNMKKSHTDCHKINTELLAQLKAVHNERDSVKNEMDKVIADHGNEIAKLNETSNQAAAEAKVKIERLKQDKEVLRQGLDNSFSRMSDFQAKLKSDHKRDLEEIREEHKKRLQFEKRRSSDAIEELKVQHNKKIIEIQQKLKEHDKKITALEVEKSNVETELKKKCEHFDQLKSIFMRED